MGKRIMIMAGGTGGHVFPALAVALEMRRRGWQVSWLGTRKGLESRIVPSHQIDMDWLSVAGLRGKGILGRLTGVARLSRALIEAVAILLKRKPDVVLGMGGFVSGPGGLISSVLGIPLLIHEQNRVPGTTNRLLIKRARKVLEAFPDSFEPSVGAINTGNPLRSEFAGLSAKSPWSDKDRRPVRILIIGGSQGAQRLNELLPQALGKLNHLVIKHQSGAAMQANVQRQYDECGAQAEVYAFIDDMVEAYRWTDMVICRAGAMTVSEVAAAGLPALFVPLPNAIDDHQTANARFLTESGAALMIAQDQLNHGRVAEAVAQILANLQPMSEAALARAQPNATEKVADWCEQEAIQ